MGTTTFGTAVVIFVNFWLIVLIAFGTATSAIFLYILNGVTKAIAASTAISLLCSAFTVVYLVLQSVNVAHIKRLRWHGSWLSPVCIQLPRVLIACWVPTTAVGLWSALKQPACERGTVVADADAWQNGLSCWVFRVMVSLTVVMLVLMISNLMILEINGRRVPIGLFHFEYTPQERGFEHTRRYRRTNLAHSTYGTSVESLASPRTINSEDELQLTSSAEKLQARDAYAISPSPTYRTLDLSVARTRAPSLPSALLPRQEEESFIDLPTSRNSTCTTLTLSSFPATPTSAATRGSIFASSQLTSRPLSVSDLPALPTSFQRQVQELEAIKRNSTANASKPVRPALTNITNGNGKIRSSSAVPMATGSNDMVGSGPEVTIEKTRSISLTETIEQPSPAWCPNTKLKVVPLTAGPAIKRLTELRRNSKLGIGFDRMSRRISLSGFEFGFGGSSRATKTRSKLVDEEAADQIMGPLDSMNSARPALDTSPTDMEQTAGAADEVNQTVDTPAEDTRPRKTMERKHPIRGAASNQPKRPNKSLSIMPPPVPERATGHARGQSIAGQNRKRGKSMVERGRYEKMSR